MYCFTTSIPPVSFRQSVATIIEVITLHSTCAIISEGVGDGSGIDQSYPLFVITDALYSSCHVDYGGSSIPKNPDLTYAGLSR